MPRPLCPWEGAHNTFWIGGSVDHRAAVEVMAKKKVPASARN